MWEHISNMSGYTFLTIQIIIVLIFYVLGYRDGFTSGMKYLIERSTIVKTTKGDE